MPKLMRLIGLLLVMGICIAYNVNRYPAVKQMVALPTPPATPDTASSSKPPPQKPSGGFFSFVSRSSEKVSDNDNKKPPLSYSVAEMEKIYEETANISREQELAPYPARMPGGPDEALELIAEMDRQGLGGYTVVDETMLAEAGDDTEISTNDDTTRSESAQQIASKTMDEALGSATASAALIDDRGCAIPITVDDDPPELLQGDVQAFMEKMRSSGVDGAAADLPPTAVAERDEKPDRSPGGLQTESVVAEGADPYAVSYTPENQVEPESTEPRTDDSVNTTPEEDSLDTDWQSESGASGWSGAEESVELLEIETGQDESQSQDTVTGSSDETQGDSTSDGLVPIPAWNGPGLNESEPDSTRSDGPAPDDLTSEENTGDAFNWQTDAMIVDGVRPLPSPETATDKIVYDWPDCVPIYPSTGK